MTAILTTFKLDGPSSKRVKPVVFSAPSHPGHERKPSRDPHHVPDFSARKGSNEPKEPILYLPPLLSSLPDSVRDKLPPPPLSTDTHLPNIDPASLSLHKALHHFRPLNAQYAITEYKDAFNWSELVLPEDDEREWYIVAFRSKRREGSDGGSLYEADKLAHEEAVKNGGLIMYWYGVPDPQTGMNLATCVWQSRRHAIAANSQPHHVNAMRLAAASFEIYELERHRLVKLKGEKGITIETFNGGEVGW